MRHSKILDSSVLLNLKATMNSASTNHSYFPEPPVPERERERESSPEPRVPSKCGGISTASQVVSAVLEVVSAARAASAPSAVSWAAPGAPNPKKQCSSLGRSN